MRMRVSINSSASEEKREKREERREKREERREKSEERREKREVGREKRKESREERKNREITYSTFAREFTEVSLSLL